MKSQLEIITEKQILRKTNGKIKKLLEIIFNDKEIHYLQEYANKVSIKRLKHNDHGPVHMKKVAYNALLLADLLDNAGIKLNLEKEECGTFEDSKTAILLASLLHDIGMTIGRENHERSSVILAIPIIERLLEKMYKEDLEKRIIVKSIALEGIIGHMTTQKVHSLEAGLIMIADGCDMEKGRARIPMIINSESQVGDIHKYSALSIDEVKIEKGSKRPIKITINMTSSVGFFQVEEVLYRKIDASPIKKYIELYAGIIGEELKCYL